MRLFVGWDVGGWHCDRNRVSRDALVVLRSDEGGPLSHVGSAWRGSLRSLLTGHREHDLVRRMLHLCGIDPEAADEITFAIDAPLGWPAPMVALVSGGAAVAVSAKDGGNPYTRRETELDLIRRGHAPLSSVRDMIGSQSTKAIHFLRMAGLSAGPRATWFRDEPQRVTAFETYPAVAMKSAECVALHEPLLADLIAQQPLAGPALSDIHDALACAVVAYMAAGERIIQPPQDYPTLEGWIILPR